MDEMKACPNLWCDSITAPVPLHHDGASWRVYCACGQRGPRGKALSEAIAAWNRRPTPSEAGQWRPDRASIMRALAGVDGYASVPPINDLRPRYDLYADAILALSQADPGGTPTDKGRGR